MRRFLLPAIALLGVVAVLLAPQTSWLAQQQLKMAWLNQGEAEVRRLSTPPVPTATTSAMDAAWKLNALCAGKLRWWRSDLEKLVSRSTSKDKSLDSDVGKEALQLCAIGEKQDPDNAFFPLIRGSVLLGLRKDDAAMGALQLAADKPRFDSYEEAANRLVYQELQAQGAQGLTAYTLPLQEVWGPQKMWFIAVHTLSRGVVAHALHRQMTGDLKGAMALRHDLRCVYDLLLKDEPYPLLQMLGIDQLSPVPPPIASKEGVTRTIWMGPTLPSKERPTRYVDFLRKHGYAEEARAFKKSLACNAAKKEKWQARWENEEGNVFASTYVQYMSGWTRGGLLLLASVITVFSCGVLARMLLFTQRREVSKKGRIGALLAFIVLIPLVGSACFGSTDNAIRAWVEGVIHPCYASGDSMPEPWYANILWALERWRSNLFYIALILTPVFLAQIIGGIWALVKRRPLGQGVIGGVWRASVPMAVVTLLVWCGGVMWLAKEEARQLARFSEVLQSGY